VVVAHLQHTASSPTIWVLEHTVNRLGLGLLVVVEGSGVVPLLVAYLATCLVHLHPVSAIISRILILLVVGVPPGLDHHHPGGHPPGVAAAIHLVVEAAALAQGLLLVIKHMHCGLLKCATFVV